MSNKKQDITLEIGFEHCTVQQFQDLMNAVYVVDTHCIGTLGKDEKTVTLHTTTLKAEPIITAIKNACIFMGEVES